jgi:hypothetical protein
MENSQTLFGEQVIYRSRWGVSENVSRIWWQQEGGGPAIPTPGLLGEKLLINNKYKQKTPWAESTSELPLCLTKHYAMKAYGGLDV